MPIPMSIRLLRPSFIAAAALAAAALPALAQTAPTTPTTPAAPKANEQVIVPQVDRRDLKVPRFPSKDFEVGLFAGTYSAQNFGTSAVAGLRLGYHITEDFFVQANFGQTKVSDELFRQVLPGGIFTSDKAALKYINLSAGVNVLPGEIFIGRNNAKASAVYLTGGVGTTTFNDQKRQTINLGLGMRVLFTDRAAINVDLRDHIFSLDLLGKRQSTQNVELTAGFSFFF